MQIRLKYDLPIERRHGMFRHRVLDVQHTKKGGKDTPYYFVRGDAGEMIGVMRYEAEEL